MDVCNICGHKILSNEASILDCNGHPIHVACDLAILDDIHDDNFDERESHVGASGQV